MVARRRGLIVEVTEGDTALGGSGNVLHDLAKSAGKALAFRMSEELRPHRVAALALTPGFLRSEAMLERSGDVTSSWELAREYGFTDADGRRPDWGRHFEKIVPTMPGFRNGIRRYLALLDRAAARARLYVGSEAAPRASPRTP